MITTMLTKGKRTGFVQKSWTAAGATGLSQHPDCPAPPTSRMPEDYIASPKVAYDERHKDCAQAAL